MVSGYQKRQAVDNAIEANDYNAFVKASTPTQEEFNQIVTMHKTQKAIKAAIDNKDYNAFVTALKADTNRPTDAKIPTQEEFNKMLEK
jgi:preprotein translocase subunit Sss1